jgi:hypothetical protein
MREGLRLPNGLARNADGSLDIQSGPAREGEPTINLIFRAFPRPRRQLD